MAVIVGECPGSITITGPVPAGTLAAEVEDVGAADDETGDDDAGADAEVATLGCDKIAVVCGPVARTVVDVQADKVSIATSTTHWKVRALTRIA